MVHRGSYRSSEALSRGLFIFVYGPAASDETFLVKNGKAPAETILRDKPARMVTLEIAGPSRTLRGAIG